MTKHNNTIPYRGQNDGLNDAVSEATQFHCDPDDDLTRQEYKDEANLNNLLAKFGIESSSKKPLYGEQDFDIDLQQALESIHDARRAYDILPDDVREKYGNWRQLLEAAEAGHLDLEPAATAAKKAKLALDARDAELADFLKRNPPNAAEAPPTN